MDAALAVGPDQPLVRVLGLRVLVQRPHVRVGGRRVQVVVALLAVLAVVTLAQDVAVRRGLSRFDSVVRLVGCCGEDVIFL